jgi:ATP-dependent protease HslVU (ClpYQ) peptidase subunit
VTTIIGVVKNGHVILGADSQVTSQSRPNMHPKMQKITNNNGYLIAGSGDSTPCDILQHIFIPPVPTIAERKDLYKFMITKFVPAMREALDENGYKLDGVDKDAGFEIDSDFSVLLNGEGIYGIGSGSPFAIGALSMGGTVEQSLEIAVKNDIYTSGPFQIVKQSKTIKKS